jgi:hypothetical protein
VRSPTASSSASSASLCPLLRCLRLCVRDTIVRIVRDEWCSRNTCTHTNKHKLTQRECMFMCVPSYVQPHSHVRHQNAKKKKKKTETVPCLSRSCSCFQALASFGCSDNSFRSRFGFSADHSGSDANLHTRVTIIRTLPTIHFNPQYCAYAYGRKLLVFAVFFKFCFGNTD